MIFWICLACQMDQKCLLGLCSADHQAMIELFGKMTSGHNKILRGPFLRFKNIVWLQSREFWTIFLLRTRVSNFTKVLVPQPSNAFNLLQSSRITFQRVGISLFRFNKGLTRSLMEFGKNVDFGKNVEWTFNISYDLQESTY